MCGINNILAFKGGKNHKKKDMLPSFGITVVISCKGCIQDRTLYCCTSVCSHMIRTCQGFIFKMCEVHSQIRVKVHIMRPIGSKGDKKSNWPDNSEC